DRGQGKLEQALGCLDEYLKTQPQGVEAYEQKIEVLRKLGRGSEVVPALQRHAQEDANNVDLQVLLGRQLTEAGRVREAEQLFDALLQNNVRPEICRGLFKAYQAEGAGGGKKILDQFDAAVRGSAGQDDAGPLMPAAAGEATAQAARARAMLVVLRDDADLVKLILPPA